MLIIDFIDLLAKKSPGRRSVDTVRPPSSKRRLQFLQSDTLQRVTCDRRILHTRNHVLKPIVTNRIGDVTIDGIERLGPPCNGDVHSGLDTSGFLSSQQTVQSRQSSSHTSRCLSLCSGWLVGRERGTFEVQVVRSIHQHQHGYRRMPVVVLLEPKLETRRGCVEPRVVAVEPVADIRSGETGHDVETDFLRSVEERTVVMVGLLAETVVDAN
mmetsp:Transcript_54971/g.146770  ORF Transcript_54971/g.146770 Transcript_54971/m.146770 type:complete len:213 (-) Transcript_54971:442-1080(-)